MKHYIPTDRFDAISMLSRSQMMGFAILSFFFILSLGAGWFSPFDPNTRFTPFLTPSSDHPLGTNDFGNDILSQLIHATAISLQVGLLSAIIALTVGITVGVLAGYYRGWTEQVLLGLTDTALLVPALPLMIVLVAYTEPSLWIISVTIAALAWCPTARVLHTRTMELRETPYVLFARSLGKNDLYIILRHIIPNAKEVIGAKFAMAVTAGMIAEASLSFLGLGDPFNLSWGGIINQAFNRGGLAMNLWWWYMAPGLVITIVVVAFIMVTKGKEEEVYRE